VLRTRILTAAATLPPLLAFVIFAPAWAFSVLVGGCAAWGLYEVGAMGPVLSPGVLMALALVGGVPAIVMLVWAPDGMFVLAAVAVALMCGLLAQMNLHGDRATLPPTVLVIIGGLYVGALYPYLALLHNMAGGVKWLLLMLLVVMAGDSAAYLVGRRIGRHKLMPAVSPGKTVEGAAAYVASSVAAAWLLARLMGLGWSAAATILFAVMLSVVAQVGDLAESAFKRLARVKDSGWLFPGHGGLLDRADSLVFAAVFTYYYSRWLGLAAA
jgi:phosphatidate cytidylyltransferase